MYSVKVAPAARFLAAALVFFPLGCESATNAEPADEPLEDELVSKALIGTFAKAVRMQGTLKTVTLLEKDASGARRFIAAYSVSANGDHFYRGTYKFWRRTIRLTVEGNSFASPAPFERFSYTFDAPTTKLVLTPLGGGPSFTMTRATEAYCDDVGECALQRLTTPGCVGEWTCETSACAFSCQSQCVAQGGECHDQHILSESPELCPNHQAGAGCGVDDVCCLP